MSSDRNETRDLSIIIFASADQHCLLASVKRNDSLSLCITLYLDKTEKLQTESINKFLPSAHEYLLPDVF